MTAARPGGSEPLHPCVGTIRAGHTRLKRPAVSPAGMGGKKERPTGGTAGKKSAGKALTPFDIRAAAAIKALAKTLPAKASGGSGGGGASRPSGAGAKGDGDGKAGANVKAFPGPKFTEPKVSHSGGNPGANRLFLQ